MIRFEYETYVSLRLEWLRSSFHKIPIRVTILSKIYEFEAKNLINKNIAAWKIEMKKYEN